MSNNVEHDYTIAVRVVFESTIEVDVQAYTEQQAIDLAIESVDVAEAHAQACHSDSDYWTTITSSEFDDRLELEIR
jgi:hypothetical protein|tara:strand:- start:142 stop:369 length:228 start_codon:yes stop_codon:yes gene_type:complete